MLGIRWRSGWPRTRRIPVLRYDDVEDRWKAAATARDVTRTHLTVSTFNIWFDPYFAGQRYQAIADLLGKDPPDVMVFQEVTEAALAVFLAQPWIRRDYFSAAVAGRRVGNYGMLLLSRAPMGGATYTRLPTRARRGILRADLLVNGGRTAVCSVHLDSGKRSAALRARQLGRIFGALEAEDDAVVLGDFNMREHEDHLVSAPFRDVWCALRPHDAGYTEDTSINDMLVDSTNKKRSVRFDRVLLKGQRWRAETIDLIGTEPISPDLPRVFPSDHFGVRCLLSVPRQQTSGPRGSAARTL